MPELMTQTEYAKHQGVSFYKVHTYINQGKISEGLVMEGGKRRINPEIADRELEENTNPVNRAIHRNSQKIKGKGRRGQKQLKPFEPGNIGMTLTQAQTITARLKAGLMKLDYEERKGNLVSAEQVAQDYFNAGRTVRDALLAIPTRIAGELASQGDQHVISERLTEEISQALEGLKQ